MDAVLLGLRVALALGCVLGLIWVAGRRLQGTAAVRRQRSVPLSVIGRQSLGKSSGVALVEVAGRVLLLGVGEQGVRVLTEVDVPAVPEPAGGADEVREVIDLSTLPQIGGPRAAATGDERRDEAHGAAGLVPTPRPDGSGRLARPARPARPAAGTGSAGAGALRGSVLSPDTWRRTADAVHRRAGRR